MTTEGSDAFDEGPPPSACRTMGEVRAGVDAIDRALIELLVVRQAYMDAAARLKSAPESIRDEARIAQVLANVERGARTAGLSWAIAEPVWRTLIERCIAYETEAFQARGSQGRAPSEGAARAPHKGP